ncbi:MAG TPA: SUF system Fe-S cluster assembly protein [Gammaproteobacteria bacterium]|nr:SUF system Fe-S cluster assembly protein [Gammaproteobacteria bacterium]
MGIDNLFHAIRNAAHTVDEIAPVKAPELPEGSSLEEHVIAAMRTVHDPEISVNIYDLGLIYNIDINDQNEVFVDMTLTAPACPVAGILPGQVEAAIKQVDGVSDAHVELVWDPPWGRERISDEGKLAMGLF